MTVALTAPELMEDFKFLEGYKRICELAVTYYDGNIFKEPKEWYMDRVSGCNEIMTEIERRLNAKGYSKYESDFGGSYWARPGPDSKDAD